MTFESAAYAINGARISAALARRALYAEARAGGIVQKGDLKVSQLSVPGVGVLIAPGVGIVLNDYQDTPNEAYVASNPSAHTFLDIPAASPSARSFILAVVIGDPDFSQAGHPFMPSDGIPAEQRDAFQYVRPVLIQVANSTVTTLDTPYPALPLARIDIPANTTTITNAMITDLRRLASPRQQQEIFVSPASAWNNGSGLVRIPSGSSFADWGAGQFAPTVRVPVWAKRAILVASVNGVRLADSTVNVTGAIRVQLGTVSGPQAAIDFPQRTGQVRDNLQAAGEYDVTTIAGQSVAVRLEGFESVPASPTNNQRLALAAGSQVIFDIRFFEE